MKSLNLNNKKGYFFTFDVALSIFVLIIGLIIVFSYLFNVYQTYQTSYYSTNIMNILFDTKIKDSQNKYFGFNGTLVNNENITDLNNNIITQIAEFYYRNQTGCTFCLDLINKTIHNMTTTLISDNYYYIVKIDDNVVYNSTQNIQYYNASQLIPSKTIIYGIYNNKFIYGPYNFEVWAWR
jgi:hypothetical protein